MAKRDIFSLVLPWVAPLVAPVLKAKSLTIVAVIIAILAIIIVPLPSIVLDFFLALSIAISVLIILISLYIPKPTDLTTFPTLILIITLFRLSLNIATTRMILSEGHQGPAAVSDIVASFGEFVVGGNYVIGMVIFCILVLINFMVVTKGSTRVSEVQARFTLDAMPGKQMAIDADLNAGLIDEKTARQRRQEIIAEANFYGAMDGSSKFIKGDAVAGIIITIVNLIGGFMIGYFQHDMELSECASTYTILTIGDGLVSQIPGLITSTATAIIITRASKDEDNFAEGSINQLLGEYKTLLIVGFILFIFALVPGLPHFSLGFMALMFLGLGYMIKQVQEGKIQINTVSSKKSQEDNEQEQAKPQKRSEEEILREEENKITDILKLEILELELGYGLIKLAESELTERIRSTRRNIAQSLGFLMPKIRIRDNLQLKPNEYTFKLKGVGIASAEIYPDKYLAMDSGFITEPIEGIATKEPAFNSDALWIDSSLKDEATLNGYIVIDPASVISTHMSELIKANASELLTKQEVQNLLDKIKNDYPIVVDDCLRVASIGLIQKVLKALLKEHIPIKDMLTILESISDIAEVSKSLDMIIEHVRASLARAITNLYVDEKGQISFYIFDAAAAAKLMEHVQFKDGTYHLMINVAQTGALVEALKAELASVANTRIKPFLLCVEPQLRKFIADICSNFGINITVLSFAEIAENTKFETEGIIKVDNL
ncbi:flagellar export apparatus, flagellar biosynthetic protein FlhA [Campylobacter subantarcticus LMG 24377]|uniref:Flagellar biosynthesis protein FlhA n=1 Tax=Campylobacter subantarcticus TaxID=497724 RepID=A0ABW9N491_9BACT|nr:MULTISPECIES: flagellar biosynthesis protein FlhA [Campylobacter]EAL3938142.1 flagellar biosynthesis protein FlhA [Campylobacter lari]AJC92720.1 flagellar export apparatus, flagellar biosynthetic protein FlhA [Campylobacter subantarcticus LMG 24377]MPB99069.1 flagellar biosynthesis protein FlhA [Campylobacter subantarcticus]QOR00604.1 flagellar biosynthesis protein FlhA [Campylobacter sp. 2014D-0216]RKO65430.1 flagellar biosynthetic protein [Campylobacter sp. P255]